MLERRKDGVCNTINTQIQVKWNRYMYISFVFVYWIRKCLFVAVVDDILMQSVRYHAAHKTRWANFIGAHKNKTTKSLVC